MRVSEDVGDLTVLSRLLKLTSTTWTTCTNEKQGSIAYDT